MIALKMNTFLHENPDFVLWAALVVFAYAATLAILVRLRRADPAAMRIAAVGALALLLATYFSLQETKSRELRRVGGLLIQSAPAYAKEMEKMGHAQITLDTPADDPRYLRIINETLQWIHLNPIVKGIYTCRRTGDGKIVLIVGPEVDIDGNGKIDGLDARSPIGTPWEAEIPDIAAAFSGKTVMTGKPYKDQWGEWLTAFSPVRNAQGKVEAVLGVDYPAAQWMLLVHKACLMRLLGWGLLATVFLGGCGFISVLLSDLKQRRRIEEQLRDTEERFRHLAEQSRDLVLEFDVPSRRIRYASPNHLQVTGFSPSHLIGRDMLRPCIQRTSNSWRKPWKRKNSPPLSACSDRTAAGSGWISAAPGISAPTGSRACRQSAAMSPTARFPMTSSSARKDGIPRPDGGRSRARPQ